MRIADAHARACPISAIASVPTPAQEVELAGNDDYLVTFQFLANLESVMTGEIVSAVFDSQVHAQTALTELRLRGFDESSISLIAQQDGTASQVEDSREAVTDVIRTTAFGAGAGSLLGIAALAIPGVGPFVAAGAIAASAVPGAAMSGAAVGAAIGGVAGILTAHGVDKGDAHYYQERITTGGIFVSVDTSNAHLRADEVRDILFTAGGQSSTRRHQ